MNIEILTKTNEKYSFDHLICALPAYELAHLLDRQHYHILQLRLNQISFVNMIVINLLYEKEDIFPQEAFDYLIPSREKSHLLGVLFDSCIRHAADRHKRGSQLTDEQLMHIVTNELKQQMNLHKKPLTYSISRFNPAIPVSTENQF